MTTKTPDLTLPALPGKTKDEIRTNNKALKTAFWGMHGKELASVPDLQEISDDTYVIIQHNNGIVENLVKFFNQILKKETPADQIPFYHIEEYGRLRKIEGYLEAGVIHNLPVDDGVWIKNSYIRFLDLETIKVFHNEKEELLKALKKSIRFRDLKEIKNPDINTLNDQEYNIKNAPGYIHPNAIKGYIGKYCKILAKHPQKGCLPNLSDFHTVEIILDGETPHGNKAFPFVIVENGWKTKVEKRTFVNKEKQLIEFDARILEVKIKETSKLHIEAILQQGRSSYAGTAYNGPTRATSHGMNLAWDNKKKKMDQKKALKELSKFL